MMKACGTPGGGVMFIPEAVTKKKTMRKAAAKVSNDNPDRKKLSSK